jgi:hypothetical protein
MSIFDYNDEGETYRFSYTSKSGGERRNIEFSLDETAFPEVMDAFLSWAGAIFEWPRELIRDKAIECAQEWEV